MTGKDVEVKPDEQRDKNWQGWEQDNYFKREWCDFENGKINEALEYLCETDVIYDYARKIKSEGGFCGATSFEKKNSALPHCQYILGSFKNPG